MATTGPVSSLGARLRAGRGAAGVRRAVPGQVPGGRVVGGRVPEAEVIPASEELGISQVVFSPIAQGVLTGKYRPGQAPPEGSRATDEKGGGANFISRWMKDDVLSRVQELKPIADDLGLSMAALAVAWVLQEENVAAAIIGASRPEQVAGNVAASGVRLEPDVKARIDEVLAPVAQTDPALTRSPDPRP